MIIIKFPENTLTGYQSAGDLPGIYNRHFAVWFIC